METSQEKTGFKAPSLETLKQLVASGLGVTLLPEMMVEKSAKNAGYVVLKHFAKPVPSRKVAMLWRKHSARVVCYEKIMHLIRE